MGWDKKRICTGVGIGIMITVAMTQVNAGNPFALICLLFFVWFGMREIYDMLDAGGIPCCKQFGRAAGLIFVSATWLLARLNFPMECLWWVFVPLMLAIFIRHLFIEDNEKAVKSLAGTTFGFMYMAFAWSFFVRIFMACGPNCSGYAAFYLLLVTKFGDAGAYFFGSRIGKTPLSPRLSPNKSVEGLFGGILFSTIFSFICFFVSHGKLGLYDFPWYHALILGLLMHPIGTLGDLMESQIKRGVKVKDSGAMAHGLGGMLDMIDSVLFCAPFLWVYMNVFL